MTLHREIGNLPPSDKIILFYIDGTAKPMACFQDGPWMGPWSWYSMGGLPESAEKESAK